MINLGKCGRVLIAEADPLIGLALSQMLDTLGCLNLTLVTLLDTALLATQSAAIKLAILDLQLTDGISQPIADVLSKAGIPAIFTTTDRNLAANFGLQPCSLLHYPFGIVELESAMDFAFSTLAPQLRLV